MLASYALLAVAFTWPLAPRLGAAAPGVGEDTPIYLWNLWWIRQLVTTGFGSALSSDLLLRTSAIFHPNGTTLALHSLMLLPDFMVLPITIAVSPAAALGCVALLNCVLNAASVYRLVSRLTGSRLAAWPAGALFAYSPWALGELQNHYNLDTLWPFVLFVDGLLRLLERPRLRSALEVGAAFAAMVYADLQFPLLALIPFLVVVAARLLQPRDASLVAALRWGSLGLLTGLILSLPVIVPAFLALRDVPAASLISGIAEQSYYSVDVTDLLQLSPLRAGGQPVLAQSLFIHSSRNSPSQFTQLGYCALALAVCGLTAGYARRAQLRGRFGVSLWAALALCGLAFALGPALIVDGKPALIGGSVPVVLAPGLLATVLPGIQVERVPSRHFVSITLALAVLAGLGISWLTARLSGRRRAIALAIVSAAVLYELWPAPLPLEDLRPNPAYADLTEPGAVIDVPFAAQDGHTGVGIYRDAVLALGSQAQHGHPLVGGYVSRAGAASLEPAMNEPALRYLAGCRGAPPTPDALRTTLERYDVRYVIVHRDWPRAGAGPRGCATPPAPAEVELLLAASQLEPLRGSPDTAVYRRP